VSAAKLSRKPPIVLLADFKRNSRRLLPADHPLLRILERVPDRMAADELAGRLDDWLVLLEAG